jgi:hypothetical protein
MDNIRLVPSEDELRSRKFDPIVRDWFKESRPRARKGGPQPLKATGAAGQGTRPGQRRLFVYVTRRRHDVGSAADPAGAITVRDLTARDRAVDAEPTMPVRRSLSVRRPGLSPHRRSCILLAAASLLRLRTRHTALCCAPFNEGGRERNRGYVVVTEPSSDTPVVMPCKTWTSLSLKQCLSPTSPELVGFFCSSPVQPGSTAAELSPAKPVVSLPSRGTPEHTIQAPPSVRAGGGVCCFRPQHPLCAQLLWRLKAAPVMDLSVIVG